MRIERLAREGVTAVAVIATALAFACAPESAPPEEECAEPALPTLVRIVAYTRYIPPTGEELVVVESLDDGRREQVRVGQAVMGTPWVLAAVTDKVATFRHTDEPERRADLVLPESREPSPGRWRLVHGENRRFDSRPWKNPATDRFEGIEIHHVPATGPYSWLGLIRGDVLLTVGGVRVVGLEDIIRAVRSRQDARAPLVLTWLREGQLLRREVDPEELSHVNTPSGAPLLVPGEERPSLEEGD